MPEVSPLKLNPPSRILMGPGPSNVPPRVQSAMTAPLLGYFDPYFFKIMDSTMSLLKAVFQTKNKLTFPISGTGMSGMEAGVVNFLEPGDVAVIGVNGFFGDRIVEIASRCGAKVVKAAAEWGKPIELSAIEAALKSEKKVKLLAVVHAETSTGVLQPLGEISKLAKQYGALFLVDTVTSLGGHEVAVDEWGIDISYSASQKGLSCPPGLAPFTCTDAALAAVQSRKTKVSSWYFDLSLLSSYWSEGATARVYHHTAPALMVYAFHEALAIIAEEGLPARFQRHLRNGTALQAGLEAMGLSLFAQKGFRLSTLTSVRIPEGVNDAKIRQRLLNEFNIEIGGGLGALKGRLWRIGLMGHSSTEQNVLFFLYALEKLLSEEGYQVEPGVGVSAAVKALRVH